MPELDTAQAKIVFDNISEKINIGDYETYLSKMQDPANRELFFKSVSEKVNIGDDYNEFEKNITKSTPTATANNLTGATASGKVAPKTETATTTTTTTPKTGYSENITNFVTLYQKDPTAAMQLLPTISEEEIKATPLNSMVKESIIKAKKNLELSNTFKEPILQAGVMRGVEVKAKQKEKDVPTLSFASIYKEAEKQKEDITIPYSSQEQTVTPLPKEDILKANLTLINSYLSKGDVDSYNTALKMTKIQAEKYPYLKSYANRLESYIKRKEGDFEGASKSYDNIEDDSKTISDFNISAYSKVKAGKVEEANEDIDKAIERGNPSDINDIDDLIYSWQLKGNMAYNAGSTELMEQASSKIKELKYAKDRATKDNVFTIFTKTPLTQEEWDKQYNILQKNIITSPILGAAEAAGMALQGVYEMSTPPPKDKVYTKEEYDKEKNDRVLLGYSKALNGMVSTAFNTFPSIYAFNIGMGAIGGIEKEVRNKQLEDLQKYTNMPMEALERAKEEEGVTDTVSKWIFAPLTTAIQTWGDYDSLSETQKNFLGLGDVTVTILGLSLAHKGVSALKKNILPAIEDYIKAEDKFTTDKGVREFREGEAKVEATAEKIKNIDIDKATLDAIMEMKKEAEPIVAVMDKINKGEPITEAEGKLVVDFIDQTMKDPEFIIKTFKKEPIQVEKKVDNSVQGNLNRLRTEEANIVNKKEYAGIDDLYKAEEIGNEIGALNEKVNKVIAEKTKAVQEQIDLLKQERNSLYEKEGISNEELLVNSEIEADINTRLQPLLKEKQNIINEIYELDITELDNILKPKEEAKPITIDEQIAKTEDIINKEGVTDLTEGTTKDNIEDAIDEVKQDVIGTTEKQVGEIPLTETTYNFESVKQENVDKYDYYKKEVDGVTKYFKKEKSVESQQKIEQIKDIPLSAFENKIEGRFLDKKQADELQKEIESNYIDGDMMEHFSGKKQDIRMNLFNYDNPLAQKNVNGVNLRIAEGLIRNKRRTYLLYADGNIIGEFYSVKDIKSIIKHIEDNLVKSIPSKAQTVTPIEVGKKEVVTDKTNELIINNLNPTGGLLVDYNPKARMTAKLADNITTLDKTMGGSPDDIITIYRGATKKQKKIVPGDYITTNKELAKSYTGDGNVLEMEARKGDILDDINEPLGEEYIYRPKEHEKSRKEKQEANGTQEAGTPLPESSKMGAKPTDGTTAKAEVGTTTKPTTTPKVENIKKSSTEIAKGMTTKEKIADANAIIGDELSKLMNQIGVKKGLLPEDKVNIKRLVTAMAEKTGLEIKLVIEKMKEYLEKEYPSSKKEINDVLDEVIKEQETTTTPELSGIKHADTAKDRSSLGMEEYEGGLEITEKEAVIKAKKWIADGGDVRTIIDKLKNKKYLELYESAVIGEYKNSLSERIAKNPTPELLKEHADLIELIDKSGTDWSETGLGRKLMSPKVDNLANFLFDRSKDKGYELTPEQIKEETTAYNELKKKNEELEVAMKLEQDKVAKLEAEKEFRKIKNKSKREFKKTHEEYVIERKDILSNMRESLRKSLAETYITLPLVPQLKAIAPHVKLLVESYAKEGLSKLDDIINKIYDEIKNDVKGITKSDINDIISGAYNETKTRSQKLNQVRMIEKEASLLKELASARKNIEKVPLSKKGKENERILELQKKIKEVRKHNKNLEQTIDSPPLDKGLKTDKERIADREKFLLKKQQQLISDIKSGNYAKEPLPKPKVKYSRRVLDLMDDVNNLKQTIKIKRLADQQNKKTGSTIIKIGNELLAVKRLGQTAMDLSIMFRQLSRVTLNLRYFKQTANNFKAQLSTVFSPKKFARLMDEIHRDKDYHDMVEDNIIFNDLNTGITKNINEEYPRSILLKAKHIKEPFLASNRAADAPLNYARFQLYKSKKAYFEKRGIFRDTDPQVYKDMGNWVMNMTSRGKLLKILENSQASAVLGKTFYGVRLMASQLNTLNPKNYIDVKALNPLSRKKLKDYDAVKLDAVKDMVGFTSGVILTGAAAVAAGAKVSFDPNDPDFLQVRYGDKVYDITGGLSAYVRTTMRIMEAIGLRAESEVTGKNKGEADRASKFAWESTTRFFRNKLAPNTSSVVNLFYGKNTVGEEFNYKEFLEVYPMYADDFIKAMKEDGISSVATVLIPNLVGIGYGSYANKANRSFVGSDAEIQYQKEQQAKLEKKNPKLKDERMRKTNIEKLRKELGEKNISSDMTLKETKKKLKELNYTTQMKIYNEGIEQGLDMEKPKEPTETTKSGGSKSTKGEGKLSKSKKSKK
jgi:hypothetical protein